MPDETYKTAPKKYRVRMGNPEYVGKDKINLYLEPRFMARLERIADIEGMTVHEKILSLIEDGLKYRNAPRRKQTKMETGI